MRLILAFVTLVAVASAAPQVIKEEVDKTGVDGYQFASEIHSVEEQKVNADTENADVAVKGQFSYVGADGVTQTISYVADENGFQPQTATQD